MRHQLRINLNFLGIGTVIGLISSLVLKHVDLYYNPSLEFALMLCFVYIPYAFAEGIHLSGIMAILFCGIVMSQYAHYNLSPGYYTDLWPWFEIFISCNFLARLAFSLLKPRSCNTMTRTTRTTRTTRPRAKMPFLGRTLDRGPTKMFPNTENSNFIQTHQIDKADHCSWYLYKTVTA